MTGERVFELRVLGRRLHVRADTEVLDRASRSAWGRCITPLPAPDADEVVKLLEHESPTVSLARVLSGATRHHADRLVLQGFAVATADGDATAFLGGRATDAGVVLEQLGKVGLAYLASVVVAVDDTRDVLPLPAPLLFGSDDEASLRSPDELGLPYPHHRVGFDALSCCDRGARIANRSNCTRSTLWSLSPRRPRILRASNDPCPRCGHSSQGAGQSSRCLMGGSTTPSAPFIASASPQRCPTRGSIHDSCLPPRSRPPGTPRRLIRRTPHWDAVIWDDEAVLLYNQNPVHLAGIGMTIGRLPNGP